ncbi:MAG: YdgA family protein [Thiohalorhabdus sp.]|uniref:YdgA family protein n=1 Tax=Thiohalorhabdus sp. TaxID=3094134 RepID=UPI00398059D7
MKKAWAAGAVAVLAGMGAAVPYFAGMQAERAFRDNQEALSEHPQADLEVVRYERGWLGAEAESRLTVGAPGEAVEVDLEHAVSHGPTPATPALARVVTTPVPRGEAREQARHFFGEQAPLTADLTIGLTGEQRLALSSPSFEGHPTDAPETRIRWEGLEGTGEFDGDSGTLDLEMPGVRIADEVGHFQLKGSELRSEVTRGGEGLWLGTSDFATERLSMEVPDPESDALQELELGGLSLRQVVKQAEEEGFLDMASRLAADRAAFNGEAVRDARLALELRHLEEEAYRRTGERVREIQAEALDEEETAQRVQAILREELPRLLEGSPEAALTELAFEAPNGDFRGSAEARYRGDGEAARGMVENPALLVRHLEAEAELRAAKPLIIGLLEERTRNQIEEEAGAEGDRVERERQVERTVRQQLAMMEAMGFVAAEEEHYASQVAWNRGNLSVNGRPLNLGAAMGGGNGPALP